MPTRGPPRTTRDELAAASRQRIADAALHLFATVGFSATSTRRVAEEAGVSEGLVFHHFQTKLDLLRGVLEGRRYLAEEVKRMLAERGELPVATFAHALGQRFVTLARVDREESRLFRVLLGEVHTNAVVFEMLQATELELVAVMSAYLAERVAAGELRADLPLASAARALVGPFIWFFMTHAHLSPDDWDAAAQAYASDVATLWLRGTVA